MYGMSGPELLTQLKVQDMHRDAERLHPGVRRVKGAEGRSRRALPFHPLT